MLFFSLNFKVLTRTVKARLKGIEIFPFGGCAKNVGDVGSIEIN